MNWQRHTDGLKQAAQKKRLAAFAQTESALKQLLRQGQPITFEAVANWQESLVAGCTSNPT